jgi:hypothetical protein
VLIEGGESLAAVAVTSSSTRFAPVFVPIPKTIARYVPQYGGFCAGHVSKGELKDSDPAAFFIKLYVCSTVDSAKEFRSNIDENIRKADENWVPLSRDQGQPYNRGPR